MIKFQGPTLTTAQTFTARQTYSVTDNSNPAITVANNGTGYGAVIQSRFAVNNAGDTLLGASAGTTAAIAVPNAATPRLQIFGSTVTGCTEALVNWSSTTTISAAIQFAKSRGTIPTHTVVTSGGTLGVIGWSGSDGTAFIPAASIEAFCDGTPGTNDMPGRIVLSTTADGAATLTERARLDSNGLLNMTGGSIGRAAPVTKTGDFTVAATENWLINNKSGSTCTVTLPAASSYTGREIMFKNIQAQTLVSASSNVVPLGTATPGTAILSANAGRWATLVSDGTNWVIMAGVV